MARAHRLFELTRLLQGGALHRASDLAAALAVTPRTIYRDMDTLVASGAPVTGTRGSGYRMLARTTLPALSLTDGEVEALQLGLVIASEIADPDLKAAALSLTQKLDNALPLHAIPDAQAWKFATYPFADTARGIALLPTLRAAIKGRQKLRLTYTGPMGDVTSRIVRPLKIAHMSRVWALTAWCELRNDFREFRLDMIETADALPELFRDEVGKNLKDYAP